MARSRPVKQKHALQRLASPSRGLSMLWHVLGVLSATGNFWYLVAYPNHVNLSFGWHLQYLTIIGLSLFLLTFLAGLTADVSMNRSFFAFKNALSTLCTPLETLVSVLYWSIVSYDRRLLMPDNLILNLSRKADIGFHFNPAFFLLIDYLLLSPPFRIGAFTALGIFSAFGVAYYQWLQYCHQRNSFWTYPLFEPLSPNQRFGVVAVSTILCWCSFLILRVAWARTNGRSGLGRRSGVSKRKGQ